VRRSFYNELENLARRLLDMSSIVETMIYEAIQSLTDQDLQLAHKVINDDEAVDIMESSIEEECIKLLALQSPLAADLRVVSTVMKLVTDLERMGDNAVNIAEITVRIGNEPFIKPLIDIPRMGDITLGMVKDALDSFVKRELEVAKEVIRRDDDVDHLYSMLFDELIGMVLKGEDAKKATQAINLLFVARYLERIADHATNICERIIYMVTGERVSHMPLQKFYDAGVD
jgi:phosphate transport system protein